MVFVAQDQASSTVGGETKQVETEQQGRPAANKAYYSQS